MGYRCCGSDRQCAAGIRWPSRGIRRFRLAARSAAFLAMMTIHRNPCFRIAAVLALSAASAAAQSLISQGQVLLTEGDAVPGVAGAVIGGSGAFDFPVADLNGTVLFRARFTGGGSTTLTDRAYFLGRTRETMQMVLRSGDPEPTGTLGAGTVMIQQSSATLQLQGLGGSPRLSPEGNVLFCGVSLIGPSIITTGTAATGRNDSALLWGPPGSLLVLAQRGGATGLNGTLYDTQFSGVGYQSTSINGAGQVAFQATLVGGDVSGTTNNFATFTGTPGSLTAVIRKNDLVPVAGGGTCNVGFVGFNTILNRAGWLLHDERFGTGGSTPATTANDSVLMIWQPGVGNTIIMREGDPAPLPTGTGNYGSPTIAQGFGASGGCAFTCTLTGGTVTTADDSAMFIGGLGGFQLAAREGMPATGIPGALIGVINSTQSFADFEGGSSAFYCTLSDAGGGVTTANDQSLWIGRPGNLRLIAREGDPAPGFANVPGFVSATFGAVSAGSVQLNELGHLIATNCAVNLTTATGTTNLSCSYAWDPVNGLQLAFAQGDLFPTPAGPIAASSTGGVQFPSGDGCPLSLNNQGDVLQRVNFAVNGAIVRGRLGSNNCSPSAINATTGGVHTMRLNAGQANANQLYIVAVGGAGSRPGLPFGGAIIPINPDIWTNLGLSLLNSGPWANTFGLLDPAGKATATFTLPPGLTSLAGADLRHALAVIDFATLNVLYAGEPCGVKLF
jgi:hypothetical protein